MPIKSTFSSEYRNLFFRAEINGSYESNLKYYKTLDFLKEIEPVGYTIYPLLSALGAGGRDTSFHSFQFEHHPYAPSELNKGTLNISKGGYDKEVLSNLVIYYLFKSRENANKIYQSLVEKFSGLASKSKSSQLDDLKYTEFFDTTSNLPGLRISVDNGDEDLNGYTLTISVIRKSHSTAYNIGFCQYRQKNMC
jgi:hypothetical protein